MRRRTEHSSVSTKPYEWDKSLPRKTDAAMVIMLWDSVSDSYHLRVRRISSRAGRRVRELFFSGGEGGKIFGPQEDFPRLLGDFPESTASKDSWPVQQRSLTPARALPGRARFRVELVYSAGKREGTMAGKMENGVVFKPDPAPAELALERDVSKPPVASSISTTGGAAEQAPRDSTAPPVSQQANSIPRRMRPPPGDVRSAPRSVSTRGAEPLSQVATTAFDPPPRSPARQTTNGVGQCLAAGVAGLAGAGEPPRLATTTPGTSTNTGANTTTEQQKPLCQISEIANKIAKEAASGFLGRPASLSDLQPPYPKTCPLLFKAWTANGYSVADWSDALELFKSLGGGAPELLPTEAFRVWLMREGVRVKECAGYERAFAFSSGQQQVGVLDFLWGLLAAKPGVTAGRSVVGRDFWPCCVHMGRFANHVEELSPLRVSVRLVSSRTG